MAKDQFNNNIKVGDYICFSRYSSVAYGEIKKINNKSLVVDLITAGAATIYNPNRNSMTYTYISGVREESGLTYPDKPRDEDYYISNPQVGLPASSGEVRIKGGWVNSMFSSVIRVEPLKFPLRKVDKKIVEEINI